LKTAAAAVIAPMLLFSPASISAEGKETMDSEPVIAPEVPRRQIEEAQLDTENFEIGLFAGIMNVEDFGANAVYGVRLDYHITEDFFGELTVGRTETDKTSFERLSGGVELLTADERNLTYYNLSLGYNLLPGEVFVGRRHAFNSTFYLIGGVGSTRFAGDDRFTVNLGAGYRLLVTDSIALHIDGRDHLFDIDILGENKTSHNIEFTGGISVFF